MATRLYYSLRSTDLRMAELPSSLFEGWIAALRQESAIWSLTTSPAAVLPEGTVFTYSGSAVAGAHLAAIFVSDPLLPQAIDGTIRGVVSAAETSTSANIMSEMKVALVTASGSVRAMLYDGYSGALADEWPTGIAPRAMPHLERPLAPASAQAGDRIVALVGYRKTVAPNYSGVLRWGDGADLVIGGSSVGRAWLEFSDDLSFSGTAPSRTGKALDPGQEVTERWTSLDFRDMYGEQGGGIPKLGQLWPR